MKKAVYALCAMIAIPSAAASATTDTQLKYSNSYTQVLAARGAGRPDIAEDLLHRLIKRHPDEAQLKFELGVSLAEQNKCASAARTFDAGKKMFRMPSFDRAVQQAMEDLCPGLAPWEFSLGINVMHDTNANGGAGDSSIVVGGIPLQLSEDAVAREAYGYQATASIAYNIQLGANSYIVPSLGVAVTDYEGKSLDYYTLNPGISFRYQGDRVDWRIGPTGVFNFDTDGLVSKGGGVSARASMIVSRRSGLYFNASWLKVKDEKQDLRDYEQSAVSATFVHHPENWNVSLRAGLAFTDRDYRDDFQDLKIIQGSVGISGHITPSIGYDLSYTHQINRGSTPHFLFGKRKDNVDTISAAVSFAGMEGWYGRPYIGVSHSMSDSTWKTKTYDRTRVLFGFTKSF